MSGVETPPPAPTDSRPGHADMAEGWLDLTSMPSPHLMIVEDDPTIRRLLVETVKTEGFQVSAVPCAVNALDALRQHPADILLTDFKLPDMDGLSLLEQVMRDDAQTVAIVMTGFGTVDLAVKAMKLGASDILIKPFEPDQVIILLKRIREMQRLRHENGLLKQAVVRGAGVRLKNFQLEDMASGRHRAISELHTDAVWTSGEAAAYQRGVLEGERRAREQAGTGHERQHGLLASVVTGFEQVRTAALKEGENQVVDLALAIASKIVRECVEEKRDLVLTQVREAIARVRESREVLIRVHPEDLPSVEGLRPTLVVFFEHPVTIKIEGDATVMRGGCVLETPTRYIDAGLDAQLTRFGEALKRSV